MTRFFPRHQQDLMAYIKEHHPYHPPELMILPVLAGNSDYLAWHNASVN